jgi:hypothetical protein
MTIHTLSGKLIILACATLLATPLPAKPERPKTDLLFIENDSMKIGIDRSMGASITWLSWKDHPKNIINIHDPGRLLQQSYYAGKSLDRMKDGQSKSWSPWTWNPIQGGGIMSWARVTRFEKRDDRRLFAETIPKLWDMPDEEADAVMLQSTEFEPDLLGTVRVWNRLICKRKNGDRWGDPIPRHQELPACYFTSEFRHIESYLGGDKWRREHQPPGPPWGKVTPPLNVMACFNDRDQGVAILSPVADQHWNFGPHGPYKPNASPTDGPCIHLAPIAKVPLGPKSILEYRYWMVVGSKAHVTKTINVLLSKYQKEKISLSEAE